MNILKSLFLLTFLLAQINSAFSVEILCKDKSRFTIKASFPDEVFQGKEGDHFPGVASGHILHNVDPKNIQPRDFMFENYHLSILSIEHTRISYFGRMGTVYTFVISPTSERIGSTQELVISYVLPEKAKKGFYLVTFYLGDRLGTMESSQKKCKVIF